MAQRRSHESEATAALAASCRERKKPQLSCMQWLHFFRKPLEAWRKPSQLPKQSQEPLYVARNAFLSPQPQQSPTSLRFAAWAWAHCKSKRSSRAPCSIAAAARDRPQTSHYWLTAMSRKHFQTHLGATTSPLHGEACPNRKGAGLIACGEKHSHRL